MGKRLIKVGLLFLKIRILSLVIMMKLLVVMLILTMLLNLLKIHLISLMVYKIICIYHNITCVYLLLILLCGMTFLSFEHEVFFQSFLYVMEIEIHIHLKYIFYLLRNIRYIFQ